MQHNKKVRSLILVLLTLTGVSSFFFIYDFPKKMDLELPALEYRINESKSEKKTKIKIKGTLTRPLFRDSTFNGDFIVDKYDSTKIYELIDIVFTKKTLNGMGSLTYVNYDNGDVDLDMFGAIRINGEFESLSIMVFEPVVGDQKTAKNLRISAPATNYDEAILINNKLLNFDKSKVK